MRQCYGLLPRSVRENGKPIKVEGKRSNRKITTNPLVTSGVSAFLSRLISVIIIIYHYYYYISCYNKLYYMHYIVIYYSYNNIVIIIITAINSRAVSLIN